LGRFDLTEIRSAPRGVPQIEVSFDIDANGILHVSAKDKATGKENRIVIKSSSGLSDEEIERMVQDAEEHSEEDRKARELADIRNQGEAVAHGTRKSLEELGDKIGGDDKAGIENAISELEESVKGTDVDAIRSRIDALHQLSGQLYAQAAQSEDEPAGGGGNSGADDVVDAEFEEVDDNKKDS
ncbi:MAG: Hsp70 family protein, partial [Gammaproteobacteria bacterium]|nr:Hsp70 family protein [Gammaproteobacteria bacterium]